MSPGSQSGSGAGPGMKPWLNWPFREWPFRESTRNQSMLVLTRKLMEKLFIGDDICVTVVRLEGGQVRLGIDAPRHVSVVRAELVPERQVPRSGQAPHARISSNRT